jgi:hypothetical protein
MYYHDSVPGRRDIAATSLTGVLYGKSKKDFAGVSPMTTFLSNPFKSQDNYPLLIREISLKIPPVYSTLGREFTA